MKPVEEDRLAATLDRVRLRLSEKRATEEANRLKEVLAEVAPEAELPMSAEAHSSNRYEKLINIKDRGQIFRVDVDSIERIDAAGDYKCIYTGDNTLILRETDRTSVVSGKSVSVRVDLGGRRLIKKKSK